MAGSELALPDHGDCDLAPPAFEVDCDAKFGESMRQLESSMAQMHHRGREGVAAASASSPHQTPPQESGGSFLGDVAPASFTGSTLTL